MSTEITVVNDIVEINVQEDVIVIEAPSGAYPLPTGVYSVYGRTGNVVAQDGDYNLTQLGDVTIASPATGQVLRYNGTTWVNSTESYVGTVTSVAMTTPTGLTVTGSPITTSGTLALALATGYSIPTTAKQTTWDTAYNDSIVSAAVTGVQTKTLTLNQQDGGTVIASWTDSDATNLITEVYNQTGATLTKGTIVYINGSHGNLPAVAKALATSDATSAQTYGVVRDDITNMNNGYVIVIGNLENMDTQAYPDGTQLYLSGTTAGAWTSTKPYAPIHLVYVGIVVRSHPTQGVVEVKIQNGYELDELHNVSAQSPTNGNLLQYVSSTGLWTNVAGTTTNIAEGTNLYYTDARSRAAISLTTTSSSGSSTYSSTTGILNVPTYTLAGLGGEPAITAGTITQYWRGDKSWQTLNTTAVTEGTNLYYTQARFDTAFTAKSTTNLTEGTNLYFTNTRARAAISETVTGLDYNNTTGVLSTTTGYGIPTTASQTNWDTAYTNRITSASAPLSIATNAISISQANTTTNGYLSSTDWNTFNNKQAAGNYITALTGEATASGPGSVSVTLTNSAVIGKVLTGLNVTGGTVTATDSILAAFGKVQNQINGLIGGSIYQGTWNASTNTPTLTSSVGTKGYYYIVNVAGSTNLNGITDWKVGDWAIYDGTAWQKVDNTDAVSSVNGFTGAVSLTTDNISEGSTNLYFTNTRAQNAITLTTTGTSGAATYSGGTLNIPQYQAVLTNPVTGTGTTNTLPKFTGTSAIGNSNITDTGSLITLGSNSYVNGALGIGTSSLAEYSLRIQKGISGSTIAYGISNEGAVATSVTNFAINYQSSAIAALSTTLTNYVHYNANVSSFASSTITNLFGFRVNSSNTAATNNYGFYGDIPAQTNAWNIYMNGTANNYLAGSLGIGTTSLTNAALSIGKTITGAVTSYGIFGASIVGADVTTSARYYATSVSTAASAFTLTDLVHYYSGQGSFGAGSTVTNQYGFFAQSSLQSATNNYGFYGNLAAATGRWNLYMNGTANNYMAGSLGIGTTTLTGYNLNVNKNITGATTSYGVLSQGAIQSDVTASGHYFTSSATVQNTAFTLTNLYHYRATGASSFGSATVTNQYGFIVDSVLTGATNNYGFYGNLASASNVWNLYMNGTANNYLAGSLGIGASALTGWSLKVGKTITGATTSYGIYQNGTVQSDVTGSAYSNYSLAQTAAAAFTLGTYVHYIADQGTIGSGSAITNQYGFFAQNTLTGATNNYGFFGNIASGTNRWNLYMAGTAYNHLAGRLGIGQTFATSTNLVVNLPITGSTTSNGIFQFGIVQSDSTSAAYGFRNQLNTAAAAFTLATYSHYSSQGGGTVGAGSTITSQIGFWAESTMAAQATNNYGFYGSIPSATNAWNLYMAGTAANYMAGQVGVGVTSINASAKVQIDSTTQGFLPPRVTQAQRTAIASPATGLMVYQTDGTEGMYVYTSAGWKSLTMV